MGSGSGVLDPTVYPDGNGVTNYAAIDLRITFTKANGPIILSWDDGPDNTIGACGGCMPQVLTPGVYTFAYTPGPDDPWTPPPYKVAEAGVGHFNLSWFDASSPATPSSLL